MQLAVLGIGSNQSFVTSDACVLSPRQLVESACVRLSGLLTGLRVSSFYETEPMHYTEQPQFLNAVVAGSFTGSPRELLAAIQRIETEFGRNRASEISKGPRTLDIDIELFGNCVVNEIDLIIPHEFLQIRPFVLVPLLEILPDSADPISGEKYSAIFQRLRSLGGINGRAG